MTVPPTLDPHPTDRDSPAAIKAGLRAAAAATGIPFDFLLAQARRESGLDPAARNQRSSAAGLFQFTASTWLETVKKHGAKHGLAEQAAAIGRSPDGRLEVKDKAALKAILDLRRDPGVSALMAAEYARGNARVLESRLGRAATASDLHLAHFLGAGGAMRVIQSMQDDPRRSAKAVLPEAARANPEVFHEPGGNRPRTVAGLYKAVQSRMGSAPIPAATPPADGRCDLAGVTPLPRPAQAAETAVAAAPAPAPPVAGPVQAAQTFPVALPPSLALAATDSGRG